MSTPDISAHCSELPQELLDEWPSAWAEFVVACKPLNLNPLDHVESMVYVHVRKKADAAWLASRLASPPPALRGGNPV